MAFIVFFASIVVPIAKFIVIAYLALSIRRPNLLTRHRRLRLFEIVEFIGRWSMIDVFVVAILAALVQLGSRPPLSGHCRGLVCLIGCIYHAFRPEL